MRMLRTFLAVSGVLALIGGGLFAQEELRPKPVEARYSSAIPDALRGPYVSDPGVVTLLDGGAKLNGKLSFGNIIQERLPDDQRGTGLNAFTLRSMAEVRRIVTSDLDKLATSLGRDPNQCGPNPTKPDECIQLPRAFFTDPKSEVELVGIVNRMDRQFLAPDKRSECGEISVIYRFKYKISEESQSRLPVTLNLVFGVPAKDVLNDQTITCQEVARRWLKIARPETYADATEQGIIKNAPKKPQAMVDFLMDPKSGPLATLQGKNILRLELNMQGYRRTAGDDDDSEHNATHFGSQAAYVIRVFTWEVPNARFESNILNNQIDRSLFVCSAADKSSGTCAAKKAFRDQFVSEVLTNPRYVKDLDLGLINIPSEFHGRQILARSAQSISPGGSTRSQNQPFWNAENTKGELISDEEIISDAKIDGIIQKMKSNGYEFQFISTAQDFRTRLNESTCTSCHQTRAIAGFHFPGSDRENTLPANSVLLAGSPHFYGDQPRRVAILEAIAASKTGQLVYNDLATSFAGRPRNKFKDALAGTQLIGGWGGFCVMRDTHQARSSARRSWTCQQAYACKQVFASDNDPDIGICLPPGRPEIGDPMQFGLVTTKRFGDDTYKRLQVGYRLHDVGHDKSTLISVDDLNSQEPYAFYAAHQEFHTGTTLEFEQQKKIEDIEAHRRPGDITQADRQGRRNLGTGGFPGGALRLSECKDLPDESTCGLIATTGFSNCIGSDATINQCLVQRTSYAGVRACNASAPCRDDYICVEGLGLNAGNAIESYDKRRSIVDGQSGYSKLDFGQAKPDDKYLNRNDQRGVCIPPYFVFQFRSDGHPRPSS